MPGTTVITGELAVEEPAIAVGVPGAPVLSHLVEIGRNDILTGEADEVRDVVLFVGSQRLGAGLDLETAIHHGLTAHTLELGLGADGIPGCKQSGGGEGTELGQRAAPGGLHDLLPERVVGFGGLGRQHLAHAAAAAHHGLGEQPPGDGGEDELLDAHGTGALAHDGDVVGIAAKGSDVGAHPLQGRQLIQKGIVAGGSGLLSQLGQADKAHGAESVVDGHGHAAFGGPDGAVEVFLVAAAAGEAAAVNVEDDRQPVIGSCVSRGPDVQEQAVLAVSVSLALAELVVVERFSGCGGFIIEGTGLVAAGTVPGGIIDAVPVGDGDGELPPPGGGVADTLVSGDARPLASRAGDHAAGRGALKAHGETSLSYSAAFRPRMSSPANRQGTKEERRLEIFSVYRFSSREPSAMLVVTMVGRPAPKRLFSRL